VVGPAPFWQVWTGTAADTEKNADEEITLHMGMVGAGVGGGVAGTDPPGIIKIVSIEMSPVNEVPRLAVHFTDVVPAASATKAWDQGLATAACCAPVRVHWVVHTVPTQVCAFRVPMVAPAMW
jgi:hypothetical protein